MAAVLLSLHDALVLSDGGAVAPPAAVDLAVGEVFGVFSRLRLLRLSI